MVNSDAIAAIIARYESEHGAWPTVEITRLIAKARRQLLALHNDSNERSV